MRPNAAAAPTADRSVDSSALCVACGLCCNGVLHTQVQVQPEHVQIVGKLGLTIEKLDDASVGFRQPCVLYQNERCSAYPHHPSACKAYRCALLRKYESGDVTLEQSLAIVRQAKELLRDGVDNQRETRSMETLRGELAQRWDRERGLLGSGAVRQANAALALRVVALDVFVQKHFLGCRKQTALERR